MCSICPNAATAPMVMVLITLSIGCLRGQDNPPCHATDFDQSAMKGVHYFRSGNHGAALPCLERANRLRKGNPGVMIYLGETFLRTGRTIEAILILEELQKLEPHRVTGWLLLGSAKSRNGDQQGALQAYNAALKIDPQNVAALVNGGTSLRDLGKTEDAFTRFQRAHSVAPNVPESIYNIGDIHLARESFEEAQQAASIAIKLNPSMTGAYVLKILAFEGASKYQDALNTATEGLDKNPSHYGLEYERARMLRHLGQLERAEEAFKKCTSPKYYRSAPDARPSSIAYAHNEYAALLTQLGRNDDARVFWSKSIEVDPTFAQGWVNAASINDSMEKSLSMYRRAVELSPGLAEAWINIGQVYYNNFRQSDEYMSLALEAFETALAAAPASSSALYSVARTRVDLCRWAGWDALFAEVARRMRADLARAALLTSSISLVRHPSLRNNPLSRRCLPLAHGVTPFLLRLAPRLTQ